MVPITTNADADPSATAATGDGEATATTGGEVQETMEEVQETTTTTTTTGTPTEEASPPTATETSPSPPPATPAPARDIEAIKAAALAAATQPTVKKTPKSKPAVVRKATDLKKKGKKGKRSAPPRPTLVVNLGPNDVLMGRGSLFADYEGNVRLRAVVQDHRDAYAASSKHKDKQQIVRSIIEAVQALGGRFLRRVELSKEQKKTKDPSDPPSYMWSVIDEEKLVIDKVKQLFRDARLTRQMRRRKNPMEGGDLSQTEITAPRLVIPPGQPNPPGVTAPPGSVEQQLQLQRLQQQQQQQQQQEEKNPLEEQLRQQRQRQTSLEQQIRQHKQTLKQQKKKGASNKAASTSSPAMAQQQLQQQQQQQLQIPPNLQGPTGGMGMNHHNIPTTAMNHLGGMNFNTGDMGQQLGVFNLQQQQQEQFVALRAEQERQELALRAEQMRQEQERQELALHAEQMRQEQERQGLATIRANQDRQQQESLRQQQEFQAFRAEQERQELANLLRANQAGRNDPLRQFAAAQQNPMGMMQNQDTAFGGSFGAFPPDSLNRANNAGVGRSGLVDLARLAEIMQVTGPFPNQFNNQGGQQM